MPLHAPLPLPGVYTLTVTVTDAWGALALWSCTLTLDWPPFREVLAVYDGRVRDTGIVPTGFNHSGYNTSGPGAQTVVLDGPSSRVRLELGVRGSCEISTEIRLLRHATKSASLTERWRAHHKSRMSWSN